MGTIIEATATATADRPPGALKLADAAARSCLERANRSADEVDLLINAGVYEDKSISEPAIASLIQEDIGANPEQQNGVGQGTFSFDVRNGACGLLTGIHLVDGMLASGTVELGMVVASDMDPDPGVSEGFAFPAVGGAVLLRTDDSRPGFTSFRFDTFPEFADLFQSHMDWQEDARGRETDDGRNVLTVEIAEGHTPASVHRVRGIDHPGMSPRPTGSTCARSAASSPRRRPRASASPGEATRRLRHRVASLRERSGPAAHRGPRRGAGVRSASKSTRHGAVRLRRRGDYGGGRALPGMIQA